MKLFLPVRMFFLLFFAFSASASPHYVNANNPTPASPYTSWATAATNIEDVMFYTQTGDTVWVTNGIYQYGGYSDNGSNRVFLASVNMTLRSVNGPAVTTIKGYRVAGTTNGANAVRCVWMNSGCTLSGFTLTNGATISLEHGGGVRGATGCIVTNCIITGCAADGSGGGAYGVSGTLLVNCILRGNVAASGGNGTGGGAAGGTLVNCIVANNFAGYIGGGASGSTLIHCTVVSNVAAAYSGSLSGSIAKNSIIYYNFDYYTQPDTASPTATNCCLPLIPFSSANCFTNPPLFANPAAGDFHLSIISPCINAGNNALNTTVATNVDLDGHPRAVGIAVDLGVYEFQSPLHCVMLNGTNPVSPFVTWNTAATNIQDAVDAAVAGDTVAVSNGVYKVGGRAVHDIATNRVAIDKAITVLSVNGPAFTRIEGRTGGPAPVAIDAGIRCVYLTNGASLVGCTLSNGFTRYSGDLRLSQSGGGVWCEDNSATLSNCVIVKCTAATNGGASFCGSLFNCILTNNTAFHGGGAYSNFLVNCLLTANSATVFGGGAAAGVLIDCVLSNNTAGNGGGAFSNRLINCIVIKNYASGSGGGTFRSGLVNCTVVSNTAGTGGGIVGGALSNSIVYYNSAGSGPNYGNATALFTFCCTTPAATNGFGNVTNEPAFADWANGNLHLQSNSPCINAGKNVYVATTADFDGNTRVVGGTVDIGAYEFQSPASTISYAYLQRYGFPTDGSADHADPDGDGFDNHAEWLLGTDPNDASSRLQMTSVTSTNIASAVTITWQSVAGVDYFVQRGSDLSAQPVFSTIQTDVPGQDGTTSYTDITATNDIPYFYRVGVQ